LSSEILEFGLLNSMKAIQSQVVKEPSLCPSDKKKKHQRLAQDWKPYLSRPLQKKENNTIFIGAMLKKIVMLNGDDPQTSTLPRDMSWSGGHQMFWTQPLVCDLLVTSNYIWQMDFEITKK